MRLIMVSACLVLAGCQTAPEVAAAESELGKSPGPEPCSSDRFPTNLPNPLQCCQDGDRTWHTNDGTRLVYRTYGAPCREADGIGTNCGVGSSPFSACASGPCGATNQWAVDAAEVHIFRPESKPDQCGWEVKGVVACVRGCDWPVGSDRGHPEPFVDQEELGGTPTTCPYLRCLVGGIPAL